MGKGRHPNKEIDAAVQAAVAAGWTVELSNGHAWGHLLCPNHTRDGCMVAVWSTPKRPENHAKAIQRAVSRCPDCHEGG